MPRIIAIGLLAIVISIPWFYGGVLAVHQVWVAGALAVLALFQWVYACSLPDQESRVTPVLICLLAGLSLNLGQLIPLPGRWEALLASRAAEWRSTLIDPVEAARQGDATATGDTVAVPNARPTRTLYPAATRQHAALLTLGLAAFFLAGHHLCHRETVPWLLGSLTVLGGAFALLGIVQRLSWNGMIYWSIPLRTGGRPFGPIVNENNAGGFLNICLSAGIGWILWWGIRSREDSVYRQYGRDPHLPLTAWQRISTHLSDFFSELTADKLGTLVLTGLIAAGVCCTLSRGSVLAMGAGLVTVAALLAARPQHRGAALAVVGVLLAALVVTLWAGQVSVIQREMHSLQEENLSRSGRAMHWPDALRTARQFWGAGAGFGTYKYAYTAQDRIPFAGERTFEHAENQFVEALVEGGLPALILLLVAIVVTARSSIVLLQAGHRTDVALGAAGLVGLCTQVLGAAFDFGLYLPANFLAFAVLAGAVCGRVARPWNHRPSPWLAWHWPVALDTGLAGGLLALLALATWELQSLSVAEQSLDQLPLSDLREVREVELMDDTLDRLAQAIPHRADHAELHRHFAEALQQRFRIATYLELQRQSPYPATATSEAARKQHDDLLWDRAGIWQLHRAVLQADARTDLVTATNLRGESGVLTWLRPAWDHFRISRAACPLIAHVHFALAELAPIVPQPPDASSRHLVRAQQLAPMDATLWYWSGVLEANRGDATAALAAWQTSLRAAPLHRPEIVTAARQLVPIEKIVHDLLPDDPVTLVNVALQALVQPEQSEDRQLLLKKAREMIVSRADPLTGEHHVELARICEGLQDLPGAAVHYQQAVTLSPHNSRWRYLWAQLALRQKDYETAFREARQLVSEQPGRAEFETLLKQVARQMTE